MGYRGVWVWLGFAEPLVTYVCVCMCTQENLVTPPHSCVPQCFTLNYCDSQIPGSLGETTVLAKSFEANPLTVFMSLYYRSHACKQVLCV